MTRSLLGTPAATCAAIMLCGVAQAAAPKTNVEHRTLVVTATAYNSRVEQTTDHPYVGAWGDHLDQAPAGVRVVAVSPDLVGLGLKRGRHLRIHGFKGRFVVLDKTPRQWQSRIDIYMGEDVAGAKRFGKKEVTIYWSVPKPHERAAPSTP